MSATPAAADRPAEITVYTLPGCPHCVRARALLRRRGLAFREVDGTEMPDFRARLGDLTGGFTVPQIVIDGTPIGGADRLASLDRAGVLAAIADREPFPITRERRRSSPRLLARSGRRPDPGTSRRLTGQTRSGEARSSRPSGRGAQPRPAGRTRRNPMINACFGSWLTPIPMRRSDRTYDQRARPGSSSFGGLASR